MTQSASPSSPALPRKLQRPYVVTSSGSQQGVVLIIALILLVVISLMAITSMRNAGSAESVAGNVRTTELATQAAEIALRHCESSAIRATKLLANSSDGSDEATYPTTLLEANINTTTLGAWTTTAAWDSGTSPWIFVLPSTLVGDTATYKRPPECMVESLTGTVAAGTGAFVITARGFGPEVAAGTGRPQGTEVWLQSTIEIE
jgi:Tfp pilus assembly protein PilX